MRLARPAPGLLRTRGVTNGGAEAVNLIIEKTRRRYDTAVTYTPLAVRWPLALAAMTLPLRAESPAGPPCGDLRGLGGPRALLTPPGSQPYACASSPMTAGEVDHAADRGIELVELQSLPG